MKVLKKGRKQQGWSTERQCSGQGHGEGGCGALLLVEEADIYETRQGDGEGGHDIFRTFRCCGCKVETNFSPREIPGAVWERTSRTEGSRK